MDENDCVKFPPPIMLHGTLRIATTVMFEFEFSNFEKICQAISPMYGDA